VLQAITLASSHSFYTGRCATSKNNKLKKILYFFTAFVAISCFSQKATISSSSNGETDQLKKFSFNQSKDLIDSLKVELDQIYYSDQKLRELFTPINDSKKKEILSEFGYTMEDFIREGWGIVEKQDSLNLNKIEEIIGKYGYPGKSLVGEPTNKSAYYVIQHSEKIEEYFPLIKEAGDRGEIPIRLVAMMQDRLLVNQGKEQIYGTQIQGMMIYNEESKREEWFSFLWPVADPEKVNEYRKEVGLTTLEEYVESMGLKFKLYTLEEIQEMSIN